MNAQRWEEIQVSFDEIVELDASERAARLATLASTDPELHLALESMLEADATASAQLAPIDAAFLSPSDPHPDPLGLAGRTISHFDVREALGAGGMGVVYRADDKLDPAGYKRYITDREEAFRTELAKQKAALRPGAPL